MVEINLRYEGELRTTATHAPSGATLHTDAPVDNCGRGESFSPTDLVATALGSCLFTILGIKAQQKGIALQGGSVRVQKEMSADAPRRIAPPDRRDRGAAAGGPSGPESPRSRRARLPGPPQPAPGHGEGGDVPLGRVDFRAARRDPRFSANFRFSGGEDGC
ncbi:MAG: OsmC family protein [Verrucomicrobiales bacterium]